ncbi:hypothetical protein FPCIR_3324 [Fusarium pseudocircinatum]|uniref:Uncharacterized protein n=1 Tax=Fusarium pseudocircinatum TaxID=56676 RepID=A0A8H5USS8_9HYPO|nr:hypothetical protein FPCIR_3324 [Fusarium pseudocircinatum]
MATDQRSHSTSQFAKATKHWGFYKQPRQAKTLARALEATALADPEPSGAIFDIEVDALDPADENESLFHIDNTLSPDFDIPKNAKDDEDSCREEPPENQSIEQPVPHSECQESNGYYERIRSPDSITFEIFPPPGPGSKSKKVSDVRHNARVAFRLFGMLLPLSRFF